MPDTENPQGHTLPDTIDLTDVESLKLALIATTVGKLQAECELIQAKMAEMSRSLRDRSDRIQSLGKEYESLSGEIARRLGISLEDLKKYNLDLAAQKGSLREVSEE